MFKKQRQKSLRIKRHSRWVFALFGTLVLSVLVGCSGFTSVDAKFSATSPRSGSHVVRTGETLYSIAWRYGWDYKQLASANSIYAPYTIYPGQTLYFKKGVRRAAPKTKSAVSSNKKLTTSPPLASTNVPSAYKNRREPTTPSPSNGKLSWHWPAKGKVIAKFSSVSPVNKGIDIGGRIGESVFAAAAGTVVYAGSGLLGYGNLVIIKHDDRYLSAYAHNKRLLVKENQQVKARQPIAEIGSSGTDKVKLHFEIRRDGKPVNPTRYLPKT